MTFAEIAALPKEQKDAILTNRMIMRPSKREAYDEYELQAANQSERKIDGNIQAANQTERKIDGNIQAANQKKENNLSEEKVAINEIIQKVPSIVPIYEARLVD